MGFITDAELKIRVAAKIQKAPADLDPDIWDAIISDANAAAQADITGALAARGYTAAEIAAWDAGASYNRHQGLYWALTEASAANRIALSDANRLQIDKLDRRAELLTVAVTIGGVLEIPGEDDDEGAIGFGPMVNETDQFTLDWVP